MKRQYFYLILVIKAIFFMGCQAEAESLVYNDDGDYSGDDSLYEAGNYSYEYYEDIYENYDQGEPLAHSGEVESVLDYVPEMMTAPLSLEVSVGQRLELPCSAKDSTRFVRIWMHDEEMLFTGKVRTTKDLRYSLKPDDPSTLIISRIVLEDAGKFTCRIMLEQEINLTHDVNVIEAFSVLPVPTAGNITAKIGEEVTLACIAKGDGKTTNDTTFEWRREGAVNFPSGEDVFNGNFYTIKNVSKSDAGQYFCSTKSSKGEIGTALQQLRILLPPSIVKADHTVSQTGTGVRVEISCRVLGEPKPKVSWYKGDEAVTLEHSRVFHEKAGSQHVLIFNRFRSDDLGRYMCYATNELGSAQETISLEQSDVLITELDEKEKDMGSNEDTQTENIGTMASMQLLRDELKTVAQNMALEIDTLRNVTFSALSSERDGRPSEPAVDIAIFSDLERIQLEVGRLKSLHESQVGELLGFKRHSQDDLQRLWDNVNELQELLNTTTIHLDNIYSKDVLRMQDAQSRLQNDVMRLTEDLNDVREKAEGVSGWTGKGSLAPHVNDSAIQSLVSNTVRQLGHGLDSFQTYQKQFGEDLQKVFTDIDSLKAERQKFNQDQLIIARRLNKIIDQDIADLDNKNDGIERRLDELEHYRSQAETLLETASRYDEEKFNLVVKEIQLLKNQIYYLQQSVLQLRQQDLKLDNSTGDATAPKGGDKVTSQALSNIIEKLQDVEDQCIKRDKIDEILVEAERRENEIRKDILECETRGTEQKNRTQELSEDLSRTKADLFALKKAIAVMESEAKKYNILVYNLPPVVRLERPSHLDRLVDEFFTNNLEMPSTHFNEAERVKSAKSKIKPIRVRFPNIREKSKVLTKARTALRGSTVKIMEEFTDRVQHHRKMLAAFARKRARVVRKKWALRSNELFFDGKIFVFDENSDEVVERDTLNQ